MEKVLNARPLGWEFIEEDQAPFHFTFEEIHDPVYWKGVVEENWRMAFYAGGLYILTILGLQRWMRNRPAYELRRPLFWWSLCLGIFSILGFIRTLPGLLHVLWSPGGFYTSICAKKSGDVPFIFWLLMFVFSKFWELGDTMFIVLRKKPLPFLHWYHHVVTMTTVWILAPLAEPIGRWFTVLNFGVHSLIYPYFTLKALGYQLPSWVANVINSLEVVQMIVGLGVGLLSAYYHQSGYDCVRYPLSIQLFGWVYASFLILFGKLFYGTILNKRRAKAVMEKKLD